MDGLDAYGRRVEGATTVEVNIQHLYRVFTRLAGRADWRTFGLGYEQQFLGPQELLRPVARRASTPKISWRVRSCHPASIGAGRRRQSMCITSSNATGTVLFGNGKRVVDTQVSGPPVTKSICRPAITCGGRRRGSIYYKLTWTGRTLYRKAPNQHPRRSARSRRGDSAPIESGHATTGVWATT